MEIANFLHFAAYYFILVTAIRLLQAKFANTQWGPVFAFYG